MSADEDDLVQVPDELATPNAAEQDETGPAEAELDTADAGLATVGSDDPDLPLLTPAEVALMFRVDPKTVTRWAKDRLIRSIRTPGGHRRFRRSTVEKAMREWETFDDDGEDRVDAAGEPERLAA